MSEKEIASLVAKNENTQELVDYWEQRYQNLLKNRLFFISNQTFECLNSLNSHPLESPITPYGYLDLPSFLTKNNGTDEILIQSTIETAVRFLDSILDVVHFSDVAKDVISQYRKIGIGVVNYDDYLELTAINSSRSEQIEYIGKIISNCIYRVSEALAEEKGVFENWDSVKKDLKPKPFEYWYNINTGEVINSLELCEEYTEEEIQSSEWEIIPRRNSNLLIYPNQADWQIWSDRQNLAFLDKTEENPIDSSMTLDDLKNITDNLSRSVDTVEGELEQGNSEIEDNGQSRDLADYSENDIISENLTTGDSVEISNSKTDNNTDKSISDKETTDESESVYSDEISSKEVEENIFNLNSLLKNSKKTLTSWLGGDDESKEVDLNIYHSNHSQEAYGHNTNTLTSLEGAISNKNEGDTNDKLDQLDNSINNLNDSWNNDNTATKEAGFDIASESNYSSKNQSDTIVKVIDHKSPLFGQYFLTGVEDINKEDGLYKIKHNNQEFTYPKTGVKELDLSKIVDELSSHCKVTLDVVLFSDDIENILLDKNLKLPSFEYHLSNLPEVQVRDWFVEKHGISIDFIELFTAYTSIDGLHIVYHIKPKEVFNKDGFIQYPVSSLNDDKIKVVVNTCIQRIRRWQASSKARANKIAKDILDSEKQKYERLNEQIDQARLKGVIENANILEKNVAELSEASIDTSSSESNTQVGEKTLYNVHEKNNDNIKLSNCLEKSNFDKVNYDGIKVNTTEQENEHLVKQIVIEEGLSSEKQQIRLSSSSAEKLKIPVSSDRSNLHSEIYETEDVGNKSFDTEVEEFIDNSKIQEKTKPKTKVVGNKTLSRLKRIKNLQNKKK